MPPLDRDLHDWLEADRPATSPLSRLDVWAGRLALRLAAVLTVTRRVIRLRVQVWHLARQVARARRGGEA